ncbi:MAG TPA: sigma-70 family RNA polymerase sigma factor [Candidatus Acidoferrum sp.]|nr:sigma-70 family RNA polymerase sigma factor [Candidatus Acidoferrum sp.]
MSNEYFSLPENELLALARAGNEGAFAALVRQNSPMIYKISRRVLKNHEDAEDTLQNVLIKAYQRLDTFDGHSRFSTWLFRVAFNEALMTIRRNRSRRQDCLVDLSVVGNGCRGISDIQDRSENSERNYVNRDLAVKAMLRLKPLLRAAFLLHKREGWTHKEMAEELGISAETAKSRVYRARRQLREEMQFLT